MKRLSILLLGLMIPVIALCAGRQKYDVGIVGGSTSGTSAAIQAARSGAKVLLVEEYSWLGGMLTSAGVSATDGCFNLKGGIWAEFRDSLEQHYGGPQALKTGWVSNILFSPAVGNRIFQNMAAKEKNLSVSFDSVVKSVRKTSDGWSVEIVPADDRDGLSSCTKVRARLLVDATELGDIAKLVGVPYRVGMDSRDETGEECAPEKANDIVQDMTYVMTLKKYPHPVPVPEPDNYTKSEFACCCKSTLCPECIFDWSPSYMMDYGHIAGDRYMINWPMHGNDYYCNIIEMDRHQRDSVLDLAKQKSMRFLYFLQTELGFDHLGLADDEYPTADGLPFYPYHRESRRIKGIVTFTANDIIDPYGQNDFLYRTSVAVGDYPVDQHHNGYDGKTPMPPLTLPPIPSYGLPLGVMIPEGIDDMLVIEKSISVTNIVNGTTRLQPVVLQLGQAAGVVAAHAVKLGCQPAELSVRDVQAELLNAGAYQVPVLDAVPGSPEFESYQRVALTGILKYYGRHEGWANQSWLDAGKMMQVDDLLDGLSVFYAEAGRPLTTKEMDFLSSGGEIADVEFLAKVCSVLSGKEESGLRDNIVGLLSGIYGTGFTPSSRLTRGHCAIVVDKILDPFGEYDVDMNGRIVRR